MPSEGHTRETVMKVGLLALGMSVAIVTPVSAREYSVVRVNTEAAVYLDPLTIKTDGDVKTFWINAVYRTDEFGVDWSSEHQSVDCANSRIITLNMIAYRMDGTVVAQTEGPAKTQRQWSDIPPETIAAAVEDAVCHGKVQGTTSAPSFLELATLAQNALIQIAAGRSQLGRPVQQTPAPPAWRSTLRQLGRAMQQASGPPPAYSSGPGTGQPVYSPSECVGPIVAGVCHGTILPNKATHPVCHGEMLNGTCTGPMF
jgi:hypothetical protein